MLELQVKMKGLELVITIDPELPNMIETDGKRLMQILLNLLSNSLKFTFQGFIKLEITLVEF